MSDDEDLTEDHLRITGNNAIFKAKNFIKGNLRHSSHHRAVESDSSVEDTDQ